METFREILNIEDDKRLIDTTAYIPEAKKSIVRQVPISPPEGFMTGDEFEKRVKERVTKFYKGL